MGILDKIKKILPKRKQVKNNIPAEQEMMRSVFLAYCKKNHEGDGKVLCASCTALLSYVFLKMRKCPYGVGKPVCEKCEMMDPCLKAKKAEFMERMKSSTGLTMLVKHPIRTIKHKIAKYATSAALARRDALKAKADKAKEKAAKEKEKAKEKAKAEEAKVQEKK